MHGNTHPRDSRRLFNSRFLHLCRSCSLLLGPTVPIKCTGTYESGLHDFAERSHDEDIKYYDKIKNGQRRLPLL
jgi:hypothetical protein